MQNKKSEAGYLSMQKNSYEAPIPPAAIVGNYAWHEEYPYETFLLFKNGDVRKPIFDTFNDKLLWILLAVPVAWSRECAAFSSALTAVTFPCAC